MADAEDIEKRLEEEIGNLSTRLVTAVNRQVELEETVLHLRKTINDLQSKNAVLTKSDENYQMILPKYLKLQEDYKEANIRKEVVENENKKLNIEVEELTSSLFDEANTMVSNASRETYNFKIKNKKLFEEIDEKNIIISNLQDQLQDLKQMFLKMEDKQRVLLFSSHNGTPKLDQKESSLDNASVGDDDYQTQQLSSSLYAPLITSLRFDLNNYNKDFKGFVYTLIKPAFTLDLAHLKNLAFFKQIWTDEIENTVAHIPNLPFTTLLNRWQKYKVFWSSLIEGRVSIEPVKGYSEGSLKHANEKEVDPELLSVTIKDPCSFCGESRSTSLEHCRLHLYKIFEVDEVMVASYPLCHYCVLKLRNLCDFFAKLRVIKSNVFKLKQLHLFDEYANRAAVTSTIGSNFYKRASTSSSSGTRPTTSSSTGVGVGAAVAAAASDPDLTNGHVYDLNLDDEEESKLIKIYLLLAQSRLKIFYSKLGLRESVNRLNELNIEEIHYEAFSSLIPDRGERRGASRESDTTTSKSFDATTLSPSDTSAAKKSFDSVAARKSIEEEERTETVESNESMNADEIKESAPVSNDTSTSYKIVPPSSVSKSEGPQLATPEDDSDAREFEDAKTEWRSEPKSEESKPRQDANEPTSKPSSGSNSAISSPEKGKPQAELTEAQLILQKMKTKPNSPEAKSNNGLKRSKSKSKQFKAKMDKELDQTLEMLAENMEADGSQH
ncbi:SEC2 [Candida theae]|uniref:SEC2 n=1 Tax=Candida theae TaxID=1198502 RepID=A0AAD5BAN7_9ASCO|nr:SEC2 [Candida theae]KAI5948799.1 SEC2 [Candida theae]